MKTRILGFLAMVLFANVAISQTHLFFATESEYFLDSTCKNRVRKLSKGELVLVENLDPYRKKYLYGHCIKDDKGGFIDKTHLKHEKTFFPDSLGAHPSEIIKRDYAKPYVRLINSAHRGNIKVSLLGKTYILKPHQKEEFFAKEGLQRFKVETPGYQPLYSQEMLLPYHIIEMDFYDE